MRLNSKIVVCLLLAACACFALKAQIIDSNEDIFKSNKINCSLLNPINNSYFLENALPYAILDTNNLPSKQGYQLNLLVGTKSLSFTDDTTDEGFITYEYAGKDEHRSWILVKGTTYQKSSYYLVNIKTLETDTLAGYPLLAGNRIICLEDSCTDGTAFIEVWDIFKDKLKLTTRVSFKRCAISPYKIALSKTNELLIKDISNRYWKYNLR